jgi:hypothetical protein
VVQFRNPEHRPQVIHAQLLTERPLDLDEPPPAELLDMVRERLNGEPAETPAAAGALYKTMTAPSPTLAPTRRKRRSRHGK